MTALSAYIPGGIVQRASVVATELARVSGLTGVRVGDAIGDGGGGVRRWWPRHRASHS